MMGSISCEVVAAALTRPKMLTARSPKAVSWSCWLGSWRPREWATRWEVSLSQRRQVPASLSRESS